MDKSEKNPSSAGLATSAKREVSRAGFFSRLLSLTLDAKHLASVSS